VSSNWHAGTRVGLSVAVIMLMLADLAAACGPVELLFHGGMRSATTAPSGLVGGANTTIAAGPTATSASPALTTSPSTPRSTAIPAIATPAARGPTRTLRPTPGSYGEYHVPILMYHRIVPLADAGQVANSLLIPPDLFAAQLHALSEAGWGTITLGELAQEMADDRAPPSQAFVITIDDGWWDGFTFAYPVMHEYGFVATYFLISSRIDQKGFLSSGQLRELQAAGNEIGNHTEHHVSLQAVGLARAKAEVDNASDRIAAVTGRRPVSFSYPMGGINGVALEAVGECPGLRIAVTKRSDVTESWHTRFYSPRVRVDPNTTPDRLVEDLAARVGL
jgi:peptidoglycan/xylan/chitin deacetylase (PgdA/CDA1 family)